MDGKIIQEQMNKLADNLDRLADESQGKVGTEENPMMADFYSCQAVNFHTCARWIRDTLQGCSILDVHRQIEAGLIVMRGGRIAAATIAKQPEVSNCLHCGSMVGTINPDVLQCMECGEKVQLEEGHYVASPSEASVASRPESQCTEHASSARM